jgi:phosphate-selective porin OprO/OprP
MKSYNAARAAIVFIIGMVSLPSYSIDLYVDPKTEQIFAKPGHGRVKLGTFQRVDEPPIAKSPAAVAHEPPSENPTAANEAEALMKSPAAQEQIQKEVKKQVDVATKDIPKIDTKGKLEFTSKDGDFKWKIGGRLHVQGGVYQNADSDLGKSTNFSDDASIRRARIELAGTLWRDWGLKLQYDFAGGSGAAGIRDAFISYKNDNLLPVGIITGQFKEYYSLEAFSSSNDITLVERALPSGAFSAPDARRLGIGLVTNLYDVVGFQTSFNGPNASGNDIGGVPNQGNAPAVWIGRLFASPFHEKDKALHLGVSGSWMSPSGNQTQFQERPEMTPGTNRLVNTGLIKNVTSLNRFGAEGLGIFGPLSLQAEYKLAMVNRSGVYTNTVNGLSNPSFYGWYVQGAWTLTGESRPYEFDGFSGGTFKNPKPSNIVGQGGWGAWELAVRYSQLNLNSNEFRGGNEKDLTAGLNWYATPNVKFMANYVNVLEVNEGPYSGAAPWGFNFAARAYW